MLTYPTLNKIWQIVEQMHLKHLLEFNDAELVGHVSQKLEKDLLLSQGELNLARNYIQSKVSLIRDLADSKMAVA